MRTGAAIDLLRLQPTPAWARRAGVTIVILLSLLAASCGSRATHTVIPLSGPVGDAPGRLLFGTQGQFKTFAPATKAVQTLPGPEGWFAGEPAASPDGRLIAFATDDPDGGRLL